MQGSMSYGGALINPSAEHVSKNAQLIIVSHLLGDTGTAIDPKIMKKNELLDKIIGTKQRINT